MIRAAAVLLVLVVLWAPDAALGLGVYWDHDLRHHHFPWRLWAASEWVSGRVPLWAPGVANGFPLMADGQAGALYPPAMVLFAVLPAAAAMNATVLLHLWWAGLGAWALARTLGRSEDAALLAGVAYAFSGFLATHTLYLGMQNGLAWLPWLLAAVKADRPAAVGLCTAMLLLAGHPQAAAFGMLFVVAFAVHLAWTERRLPTRLAAGLALGALAASPQVVASVELARFSLREGGVSAAFANIGSLPPQELISGLLPRFFGFDRPGDVVQTYFHRGSGYWGAGENHWEMAFYLGIPAVLLACVALLRRPRRQAFWLGAAVVAVLLMLGGHTPLWPLLRHLPGLGGFRFPVRFALVLTLVVSMLAAGGLDELRELTGESRARVRRLIVAAAVLLLVGSAAGRGLLALTEQPLRDSLSAHFMAQTEPVALPDGLSPLTRAALQPPEPEDADAVPGKVQAIVESLRADLSPASPLVFFPVGLLLLSGWLVGRLGQRRAALALIALLYVDLHQFGADYQRRRPPEVVAAEPAALPIIAPEISDWRVTTVDRRQDPHLDTELISASLGLRYGTRDVILTSPLRLARNDALLALVGLDVGDRGRQKWDRLAAHQGLVDLLGVRWLLSVHDLTVEEQARAGVSETPLDGSPVHLYRNGDALPRAFLVGCTVVASSAEAAFARVQEVEPGSVAVVEDSSGLSDCSEGPAGSATVNSDGPQRLEIDVQADHEAMLVQTDSWYPGWQATLDGERVPLLRADFLFRGVVVPAGRHTVVLAYRPPLILALLWIAPSAAAGLLLWALVSAKRRRTG